MSRAASVVVSSAASTVGAAFRRTETVASFSSCSPCRRCPSSSAARSVTSCTIPTQRAGVPSSPRITSARSRTTRTSPESAWTTRNSISIGRPASSEPRNAASTRDRSPGCTRSRKSLKLGVVSSATPRIRRNSARPVSLSGLHANLPASDLPHGLGLGEERLDPPQLLELLVLLRDVLADRVEELLLGNGDRAPEDPPVAAVPVEETGLVREGDGIRRQAVGEDREHALAVVRMDELLPGPRDRLLAAPAEHPLPRRVYVPAEPVEPGDRDQVEREIEERRRRERRTGVSGRVGASSHRD